MTHRVLTYKEVDGYIVFLHIFQVYMLNKPKILNYMNI